MQELKTRIFTGWHTSRWIRLVLGLFVVWYGLDAKDNNILTIGILFGTLTMLNVACFGGGSQCKINQQILKEQEETTYEEVVIKK